MLQRLRFSASHLIGSTRHASQGRPAGMKRSAKNGFAIHRATLPSAKESGNLDDSGQVSARTTWLDSEVAHSSISFDRGVKLDLYARHAIPEVWLLDLMDGQLLVSRKPVDGQYRTMHKPLPDETVSSLLAPQLAWTLESGKSWSDNHLAGLPPPRWRWVYSEFACLR
jgi:hypothetical protein